MCLSVCVACLTSKGAATGPFYLLQLFKEKPEQVEVEMHTSTNMHTHRRRSVTLALRFCLSTISRHVHESIGQKTHMRARDLTHTLLHVQRSIQRERKKWCLGAVQSLELKKQCVCGDRFIQVLAPSHSPGSKTILQCSLVYKGTHTCKHTHMDELEFLYSRVLPRGSAAGLLSDMLTCGMGDMSEQL